MQAVTGTWTQDWEFPGPWQMSYELWRTLEEEEDGETKGRRPEIGHIFLLDRGTLYSALPLSLDPRRREDMVNVAAQMGSSG